jgi:hypothetical protein
MYQRDDIFRSTIVMARHGFSRGEYKYWSYPLPEIVAGLRAAFYPPLSAVGNRWNQSMKIDVRYPETHKEYLERCHAANQTRPTPLLLSYNEGDWNALHQDVYGENVFPIQVAFLLSEPGKDFTGGEFVLTEQEVLLSIQTQKWRLSDLDPTRERQPPCHEGHNPDLLAA